MNFYEANKGKINKILFALGTVAFIYIFVNYIFHYISPFVFGFIFSLIMEPFAYFLINKMKLSRGISSFICILVLVFIIGGIGTGIITRIISEAKSFTSYALVYLNDLPNHLVELRYQFENILELIPTELHLAFDDMLNSLLSSVTSKLGSTVKSSTGNVFLMIPGLFMSFLLTIISTFFFIKDRIIIASFIRSKMPDWLLVKFSTIKAGLLNALLGYLKAQFILMSITASICIVGLIIIQYEYALFVGFVIALIDALPIFGSGFILWPWAFVSFITKDYNNAIALLIIYGIIVITRQSLEPKVLGKEIGIHPLITLASMYIGLQFFGVLGFFIGPTTAVIVKVLLEGETHHCV